YGTAYSWIIKGILPVYRFQREYRISVRDFNKFVKDKKIKNNKVVVTA
ncbi:unnamed protein product, partial [marine sediment metagenome]